MDVKIDLAKTNEYKTRDGRRAEIKARIPSSDLHHCCAGYFGFVDHIVCFWLDIGVVCKGKMEAHPADIIGPWREEKKAPKVDWSKFPAHFRYLAMDMFGTWYGYFKKPFIDEGSSIWTSTEADESEYETYFDVDPDDYPDFSGDWKDSLCARPGVESVAHDPDDEDDDEVSF